MHDENRLWDASLPIGSESYRLVELVNQLAASIHDFQLLSLVTYEQQNFHDESHLTKLLSRNNKRSKDASKTDKTNLNNNTNTSKSINVNNMPFVLIDIKFPSIGKI